MTSGRKMIAHAVAVTLAVVLFIGIAEHCAHNAANQNMVRSLEQARKATPRGGKLNVFRATNDILTAIPQTGVQELIIYDTVIDASKMAALAARSELEHVHFKQCLGLTAEAVALLKVNASLRRATFQFCDDVSPEAVEVLVRWDQLEEIYLSRCKALGHDPSTYSGNARVVFVP